MKAMIIVNPNARSGASVQERETVQNALSAQLKDGLHLDSIEWRDTERPGHAIQLAEEAVRADYEYVFAGGGDGTINEVLNGIMGLKLEPSKRPIMGVLPFGSSNDFLRP